MDDEHQPNVYHMHDSLPTKDYSILTTTSLHDTKNTSATEDDRYRNRIEMPPRPPPELLDLRVMDLCIYFYQSLDEGSVITVRGFSHLITEYTLTVEDSKEQGINISTIFNKSIIQRCPSTEEWIRKMWYIYTMEYYAAEKNNDIMKFAGKWMELENVILSK
ncbi:hypothetical protein STEG23_025892, partial [Scotinomys teguina]